MRESTVNNDELAVFVTSTLNAIHSGILGADAGFYLTGEVNFEVAVKASSNKEGGGAFRIQVFSADGKLATSDEAVSKIAFKVKRTMEVPQRRTANPGVAA